jgi:hypothetical protein
MSQNDDNTKNNNNNNPDPLSLEEKIQKTKAEFLKNKEISNEKKDQEPREQQPQNTEYIKAKLHSNPKFKELLTIFDDGDYTDMNRNTIGSYNRNTYMNTIDHNDRGGSRNMLSKANYFSSELKDRNFMNRAVPENNLNTKEKLTRMKSAITCANPRGTKYTDNLPVSGKISRDRELQQNNYNPVYISKKNSAPISIKDDFKATLDKFYKINNKSTTPVDAFYSKPSAVSVAPKGNLFQTKKKEDMNVLIKSLRRRNSSMNEKNFWDENIVQNTKSRVTSPASTLMSSLSNGFENVKLGSLQSKKQFAMKNEKYFSNTSRKNILGSRTATITLF